MGDFVHLHNHTQYSLLDGACKVKDLVSEAKAMGQDALAITDHGNMFGVIDFYKECKKQGIKPIVGCEVYVAPDSRHNRKYERGSPTSHHLVLLCKNFQGYLNLMKLVSMGYTEGFYYKPRIDKQALFEYRDGLVCLTACIKGEAAWHAINKTGKSEHYIKELADIFGKENLFIELHNHGMPEEDIVRDELYSISSRHGIDVVATNDVHYIKRHHAAAHDVLLCIQTKKSVVDQDRMRYSTQELYMKTGAQMREMFSEYYGAIENTLKVSSLCNLELKLGGILLPSYPTPNGLPMIRYLRHLVSSGVSKRFGDTPSRTVTERVEYEMSVIEKMGYEGYFLVVQDFVKFAKDKGIPVGPGRGSVSGSIVAYALEITEVNPLEYGLLFERFLNPDRVSMPDIDIDFSDRERQVVIDYVTEKYGKDRVSQIVTFGKLNAKSTVKDIARALGIPYPEADAISKAIPDKLDLKSAIANVPDVAEYAKSYGSLFEHAKVIEGLNRNISVHAAGVVIAPSPLVEHAPLFFDGDTVSTQYDMNSVEAIGLLKMDFLGLKTLSVIDDTCKAVGVNINSIPKNDKKTYDLFHGGRTVGVFQFESEGMSSYLKRLKPNSIDDIAAMNALYRPGPLEGGVIDAYIRRKHGQEKIRYQHPLLESALNETYGIIVYQEQVTKIANVLAGFTLAEGDTLRKAMGKKKPELMKEQREKFISGCLGNGVPENVATEMFELIDKFSGYGLNKSHAVGYGIIGYQTAYLKAHYPAEFMCSSLTSESSDKDRVGILIAECRKMGIDVLPPSVNESGQDFTVVSGKDGKKAIRFGISGITGIGDNTAEAIFRKRPYTSMYDMLRKVDKSQYNVKKIQALVQAGAFDDFGTRKSQYEAVSEFSNIGRMVQAGREYKWLIDITQSQDIGHEEWPDSVLFANEFAALGYYVSGHPVKKYVTTLKNLGVKRLRRYTGGKVFSFGFVVAVKKKTDKRGEEMAYVTLDDGVDRYEGVVFSSVWTDYRDQFPDGALVVYSGRKDGQKAIISQAKKISEGVTSGD